MPTVDAEEVARGHQWTDEIRIGVLELWIQWAQYPWSFKMGGSNKRLVRETIEELLRSAMIVIGGESQPLREVTTSWETVFDNLKGKVTNGKGKGFSFDHLKPILSYIDDYMKGMAIFICLSQRLSHACLSTILTEAKQQMAH